MSSNPFAALDDSGDEGAPKAKAPVAKKSNAEKIVPASKPDLKAKPKNNDRIMILYYSKRHLSYQYHTSIRILPYIGED